MPSFDIVSRIDLQEVDNAVNITKKAMLSRFDFRNSKTEINLDKRDKKIQLITEDDMKLRAVQDTLIENLVKRKVDRKCLDAKATEMAQATADLTGSLIIVWHQLRVTLEQLERFDIAAETAPQARKLVDHGRIRGVEFEGASEQILFP